MKKTLNEFRGHCLKSIDPETYGLDIAFINRAEVIINEATSEKSDVDKLDKEFLNRAEHVTQLNLTGTDFQTLKNKREIQYLFCKYYFPKFHISKTLKSKTIKKEEFNHALAELKNSELESGKSFARLYNYGVKGIGPGEVLFYFMYDYATLGGGSSGGKDIMLPEAEYELKAVKVKKSGHAYDFKLGGTFSTIEVERALIDLANRGGFEVTSEIPGSIIAELKAKFPKEFQKIEEKFGKIAYDHYFKNHEVVFLHNVENYPKMGTIVAVKSVKATDVSIERYTSKTIKPLVKIEASDSAE